MTPHEEPPGGPFPSWGALYATAVVYGILAILVLLFLTVVLDVAPGAGPTP